MTSKVLEKRFPNKKDQTEPPPVEGRRRGPGGVPPPAHLAAAEPPKNPSNPYGNITRTIPAAPKETIQREFNIPSKARPQFTEAKIAFIRDSSGVAKIYLYKGTGKRAHILKVEGSEMAVALASDIIKDIVLAPASRSHTMAATTMYIR